MEPQLFGGILEPEDAFSKSPKPFDMLIAFRRYDGANTPSDTRARGCIFKIS